MTKFRFTRLAPWCLIALIAAPAHSQPRYTVADLGTLGEPLCCTQVWGINRHGQAVGFSAPYNGNFSKAYRTAPDATIKPGDNLGGGPYGSSANAINSLGQVAGWVGVDGSAIRAIRGEANAVYDPATAWGTFGGREGSGFGINDAGQVTGSATTPANVSRVFRTAPNAPFNPATDNLDDWSWGSEGMGINNAGQIVGTVFTNVGYRPFRIGPNAKLNPATDILGYGGYGYGINDLGQVTGWFYSPRGGVHAFRTAPNAPMSAPPEDLGTLGGGWATGNGINFAGHVVGLSSTNANVSHAFLYIDGKMWDLNDLIQPNSGWTLEQGTSINDFGQIVGNGRFMDASRAFRLDPVHPYSLRLLYEVTAAKAGANFTVKVQLLDASGANVSSPSIALQALTIEQLGSRPRSVEDGARSDPHNYFRYDSKLGGYTFDFRVKSLPDGAYKLMVRAGNDPFPYSAPFTVK